MTQSIVSKAARLIRAGDEFSKTNQKLLEAVCGFVEWLFGVVGNQGLPISEIDWTIEKKPLEESIRLGFKAEKGGWYDVYSDPKRTRVDSAVSFCETLAGVGGQRLISWLEEQTQQRKGLLAEMKETQNALQEHSLI